MGQRKRKTNKKESVDEDPSASKSPEQDNQSNSNSSTEENEKESLKDNKNNSAHQSKTATFDDKIEDFKDDTSEEKVINSNLQQAHKLPPSAYTNLENEDAIADLAAVSSTHLTNESGENSLHASEELKFSNTAFSKTNKTRQHAKWQKFKKYVYNKDTDAYCNRSIGSWCSVCSYYALLMLLFLGIFMIFILVFEWRDTRANDPPIMKINVMQDPNPGLSIVPRDNNSEIIIWYQDDMMASSYVNSITNFLERQELLCNQSKLLKEDCHFDIKSFGPCAIPDYGYDTNQPCIYLKLNNLLSWIPTAFKQDFEFPPSISNTLLEKIKAEHQRQCVYVECAGETSHDIMHLGKISYYPEQAFDYKYFPATAEMKTNPVIAIKLDEFDVGYILHIRCSLLASNIRNQRNSVIKFVVYVK